MKVQAFIPTWPMPEWKDRTKENIRIIGKYCPVTILDDPDDYFNAQWEKARQQFTSDILLWCMGDVTLPENFPGMLALASYLMYRGDIGWYAPDIAWTAYIYDRTELKRYENEIYEVPNTDSLLFFIHGNVVKRMPFIDPKISFMWWMDFTAIATARLMGMKVVRDYQFKAGHPNNTGYNIDKASAGAADVMKTFPEETAAEIHKLIAEANSLKRWPK